ncbi:hypothetical protein UPYG_G00211350 [Umbra pygmaea]|uniref:Uncharacterized protein n=1 Tax=Umbra pygmaea TaxID=75934 RepID=A0ABD0WPM0_UMBPY
MNNKTVGWHQSNILACVKLSRLPRRSASKLATRNSRRSCRSASTSAEGPAKKISTANDVIPDFTNTKHYKHEP